MTIEYGRYRNLEPRKISIVQMTSLSLFLNQDSLKEYSNKLGLTQGLFSHNIKFLVKWINSYTKKHMLYMPEISNKEISIIKKNIINKLNDDDKEISIIKKNIINKLNKISQLLKELYVLIEIENPKKSQEVLYRIKKILDIKYPIEIEQEKWEDLKSDINMLIFRDELLDLENMSSETIGVIKDFHNEPIVKNIIWKNNKSHIPKNINKLLFVLYELVKNYNCILSIYAKKNSVTQGAVSHNIKMIKDIIWGEIFERIDWKIDLNSKWRKIYEYSTVYIKTINELENEVNKMMEHTK